MIGTAGSYIPDIVEDTELFKHLRRPLGLGRNWAFCDPPNALKVMEAI